jgi:hypothetical protein
MAGVLKTPVKDDSEFESVWGMLEIVPGSIPDAPRRIGLSQEQVWMGRAPESKFIYNITTLFATFHTSMCPLYLCTILVLFFSRLLEVAVYLGRNNILSGQHCVISKTPEGIMVGDAR